MPGSIPAAQDHPPIHVTFSSPEPSDLHRAMEAFKKKTELLMRKAIDAQKEEGRSADDIEREYQERYEMSDEDILSIVRGTTRRITVSEPFMTDFPDIMCTIATTREMLEAGVPVFVIELAAMTINPRNKRPRVIGVCEDVERTLFMNFHGDILPPAFEVDVTKTIQSNFWYTREYRERQLRMREEIQSFNHTVTDSFLNPGKYVRELRGPGQRGPVW